MLEAELVTLPRNHYRRLFGVYGMNHPDRTKSFFQDVHKLTYWAELSLRIPARLIVCFQSFLVAPEIVMSAPKTAVEQIRASIAID